MYGESIGCTKGVADTAAVRELKTTGIACGNLAVSTLIQSQLCDGDVGVQLPTGLKANGVNNYSKSKDATGAVSYTARRFCP